MGRNIYSTDFLDLFKNTNSVVSDVSRRNANVLISNPTRNLSDVVADRTETVTTISPAWVLLNSFTQTMAVFGGPVQMTTRIRVSSITADTILRLSFGIDGAEVTGTEYGLARIDSLNFVETIGLTHIVTGIPSSTHTFSILASVKSRSGSGSGMSATITMGTSERMMLVEIK
jgi:hypothetical protein